MRAGWLLASVWMALVLVPAVVVAAPRHSIEYPITDIEQRLRAPVKLVEVEQARPAIEGDRSARVLLAGPDGEPEMQAHWKPVAPPGQGFNNEPRYVLAAYELQKLFLDECEYVVPPVALRALPVAEYERLHGKEPPTLRGIDAVLFLLAYWVQDVTNRDPWDPARFAAEPRYARHWGNVNILTHIINHKDANIGNLLISQHPDDPRVFSVDNDVAFLSEVSDQGDAWSRLQVDRLPAVTLARLRAVTQAELEQTLGVLAEFRVEAGMLVPVEPPGVNLAPRSGVRQRGDRVQFGLTTSEIRMVSRRMDAMFQRVDRGRITAVPDTPEAMGLACQEAVAQ
jgi:hypothetical protein